jgi:fucose 4-O-acetylase-like acetyltransferase
MGDQIKTTNSYKSEGIPLKRPRLFYIDALRGMAILLVVIGHLPLYCYHDVEQSTLTRIVDVFHMPLFMMICGVVITFETFSIFKRFKVLIPFFIFGILYSLFCHLSLLGFIEDEAKYGYWFLWAIVIFSLFLYIIRKFRTNLILGIITIEVLLLILHFFFHRTVIGMTLSTDHLWYLWPFFSLGILMKRGGFDWFRKKTITTFVFSILVITFSLFTAIYFNLFNRYWPYAILKMIMAFPICISLMLAFYCTEQKMKGNTSSAKSYLKRMGANLGTNTLQIYVLHYFIIHFLNLSFLGQYMINHGVIWLEYIISPLIAILIDSIGESVPS